MNNKDVLKAGMILLVLGFVLNIIGIASVANATEDLVDDIEEYNGSVGPDNALYGLKLAFENLDESFTWNITEKIGKKVSHSRIRISEAKSELRKQNNETTEKVLEHYREKVRETEESISDLSGNESGIGNAQIMIEKQQYVLEQLLESHPKNAGLQNAYNNSLELKDSFERKTDRKIERIQKSDGKNLLREIKKERKEESTDDRKYYQELKIKAGISSNNSQIQIELIFDTNSNDNAAIASDILNELILTRDNISSIIRIQNETKDRSKETLEATAQIMMNISMVNVQYRFALNETNRTEIIDGIYEKLSALTKAQIQDVLVINEKQDLEKEKQDIEKEKKEIIKDDKENIWDVRGKMREDIRPVPLENRSDKIDDRRENIKED